MIDPILHCSNLYNEANRFDHTAPMRGAAQGGPTRSSRAAAMVHLAMHDAYFGVAGGQALYLGTNAPTAYGGTNNASAASCAVGEAARTVLIALYPEQQAMFDRGVNDLNTANGIVSDALAYGHAVGAAMLALRGSDNANLPPLPYVYSAAKPGHRSDPINAIQDVLGSGWGRTKPFAVQSFHHLDHYPAFRGAAYKKDSEEVQKKGGAASQQSTTRTAMETVIGMFWAYDGAVRLGTPPRLYNQIVRAIAEERGNTVAQNARLFGLVNAAMGDAGIHAWHYKYKFDLWRPVIGVREYDANFGSDTVGGQNIDPLCDPFWRPLGAPKTNDTNPGARSFTPNFPAYPSGHATFGAAVFEMVRLFYGHGENANIDTIGFTFVSDELNGTSTDNDGTLRTRHERKFNSVADAMYENSISRIFLGVHWRFDGTSGQSIKKMLEANDDIGGVPLGRAIARDIYNANLAQAAATAIPS